MSNILADIDYARFRESGLANSSTLDESCSPAHHSDLDPRYISLINEATRFLDSQIQRCKEAYDFRELDLALEITRRANYKCIRNVRAAETATVAVTRTIPNTLILETVTSLTAQQFDIGLNLDFISEEENFSEERRRRAVLDMASFMFHGALHHAQADNRSHASHSHLSVGPSNLGCGANVFTDRVYFMQDVCFPQSPNGRVIRNPEYNNSDTCEATCHQALTQVDHTFPSNWGGIKRLAPTYPEAERSRICTRVTDYYRRVDRFVEEINEYSVGFNSRQEMMINIFPPEFLNSVIELANEVDHLKEPWDSYRSFNRTIASVRSKITQFEQQSPCSDNQNNCEIATNIFRAEVRRIEALLNATSSLESLMQDPDIQ